MRIHVTTVAVDGTGVILRGGSGSGKSDLALRLIDEGAELVADDYTDVEERDGRLVAVAPETIAGLMEVRGLGVVRTGNRETIPVGLLVDLAPGAAIERLPDTRTTSEYGPPVAYLRLDPFQASASAKVRLAVRVAKGDIMRADG